MSFLIRDLVARREGFRVAVERLAVDPGTIVCLMGKSGSGKSTLLDAIAGFLPIESGTIECGGIAVQHLPPERRRIAFVAQQPALFPNFSVRDNLSFALRLRGVARGERDAIAERWLERLDLAGLGDRATDAISGGQLQRVALGRALVAGFPALLLDEPFSAVDEEGRDGLRRLVQKLAVEERVSVVLVTHDRRDADAIAESTFIVENGLAQRAER